MCERHFEVVAVDDEAAKKSRRCLLCAGCLLRAMPPADKKPLSSIAPSHRRPSNRNSSMDLHKALVDSRPTSYGFILTVEANVTASDQTDLEQLPEAGGGGHLQLR